MCVNRGADREADRGVPVPQIMEEVEQVIQLGRTTVEQIVACFIVPQIMEEIGKAIQLVRTVEQMWCRATDYGGNREGDTASVMWKLIVAVCHR